MRFRPVIGDSPVDRFLKAGPRGKGDWPGFSHVYGMIAAGCERMGRSSAYLSADHEMSMADLGSGHEERMKWRLLWMREYNWV